MNQQQQEVVVENTTSKIGSVENGEGVEETKNIGRKHNLRNRKTK